MAYQINTLGTSPHHLSLIPRVFGKRTNFLKLSSDLSPPLPSAHAYAHTQNDVRGFEVRYGGIYF